MPEITWNDVLDIGLPEVDAQHKKLISLSNALIQAMVNGMGTEVLTELFKELREYTRTHFAQEEAYMESIGYPGLDEQKACHERLSREVDQFRYRLLSGSGVTPSEALDFINGWIIKHIMEKDSKVAVFAKTL